MNANIIAISYNGFKEVIDMQDYKVLIREARTKKGISQGKLATIIGISQPFVAEIESGRKKPSIEVLMKICSALEISLFGETKENE